MLKLHFILNLRIYMLSRSAVVKLKAILIVDLIIVAVAAGVYFYLQDQGVITGAAKPAAFILTDLTVNPAEAFIGEPIQISVNVTNIGDVEGNTTINLEINDEIKDSANLTLAGLKSSEIVEFTVIEIDPGNYTAKIGDLAASFLLKEAPPELSKIVLSNLKVDPYEVWDGESVTITATAQNPSAEADRLFVRVTVDDVMVNSTVIELEAGSSQTLQFTVNATGEGKHSVKLNSLSGSFTIVQTGYHTLTINRSGGGSKSLPFTLNGESLGTPYTALLPVGEYSISVPSPYDVGTGVLEFSFWGDGVRSASRTFTLDSRKILVATYTLISGYASCPSLYVWNGTGYTYITDVSNSGWLGYIGHINSDGTVIFKGGNPWDYVKIDKNLLAQTNGYFDLTLAQQWDELYYLDSAYMLVVDHPVGTDTYMSMTSYLSGGSTGKVYTINGGSAFLSPLSAVNEKGESVLEQIRSQDGWFSPGINGYDSVWNNITLNQLTLDLGDLSSASAVKLVITGMVDWGSAEPYYAWIEQFKQAAAQGLVADGTEITPAPYLEVWANGSWIRVPQDIPLPSDYRARTYTVDLTGIFPAGTTEYKIRFNNYWNVTYDYIAIDTTPQQEIKEYRITPSSAVLEQLWDTQSTSSGAFTRYGDVTALVQDSDDMFVIGRQGDQVNLRFSTASLPELAEGMERSYFFVVACWFKDPPDAWGYGFDFTVAPMPFMNMSGFPYTDAESYPYDATHLAYIQQYNTRIIPPA
jgi:hypothetical protein